MVVLDLERADFGCGLLEVHEVDDRVARGTPQEHHGPHAGSDPRRPVHVLEPFRLLAVLALALVVEREQQARSAGNPQHAVEALSMALQMVPGYDSRQFDPDVMRGMEMVLERLNLVVESNDPEAVREWYRKAKAGMTKVIEQGGHR